MPIPHVLKEALSLDQGSLPGFYFEGLSSSEIISIYDYICAHSGKISDDKTVWSNIENKDIPLSRIDEVAKKVISGEITPVCHSIANFRDGKAVTNCAAVYVFPDSVEVFYDPRDLVNESEMVGLLELVKQVMRHGRVHCPFLCDETGNPREPEYQNALQSYVGS